MGLPSCDGQRLLVHREESCGSRSVRRDSEAVPPVRLPAGQLCAPKTRENLERLSAVFWLEGKDVLSKQMIQP